MASLTDNETDTTAAFLSGTGRRAPVARLGVLVVHDLVSAIITGEVHEGDLLPPESELSAHFGVSRTVIRESVKRLEEKGMVRVVQGRGTEITPAAEWNILDKVVLSALIENDAALGILDELAVIRAQLEAVMSETVATVRTPEELESLAVAHEKMVNAYGSQEAFASADIDFHFRIMEVSGARLAQGIARTLTTRARDNARFYGAPGPDAHSLTVAEHQAILDAIAAGDSAAARTAMQDHITLAWERRRIPK
jgi:DNA-binding FadR family transcriptional regulator